MAQRGRPQKADKLDVSYVLRFHEDEYKELTRISREAGCPLSKLLRETIRDYILGDEQCAKGK